MSSSGLSHTRKGIRMSKADEAALADSLKYGSGPFTFNQGNAPLSADPYGVYPAVVVEVEEVPSAKSEKSASEPASKKES